MKRTKRVESITRPSHIGALVRSVRPVARLLFAALLSGAGAGAAFSQNLPDPPSTPVDDDYKALLQASPFQRTLNISETYALRGVAQFDDIVLATLYNRETKKTILVEPENENEYGLKLVKVIPAEDLAGVSAQVSFAGEVAELRYDNEQLESKGAGGRGRSGGGGRDGGNSDQRRGPSKEDMQRYQSLSDDNKKKLREYIGTVMKKYPDMPREERGNLIRGALIRLSDGRGLSDDDRQ